MRQTLQQNAEQYLIEAHDARMRPSVLFRPELSLDGNSWCALYGLNLQDGCAGFGDSPDLAMLDFDRKWTKIRKSEKSSR